jgi:Glycosyl hydrolase family 9/Cellulase N-terminal ig-like domain
VKSVRRVVAIHVCVGLAAACGIHAQASRPMLPIPFENSAEAGWLRKPVLSSRMLDDMSDSSTWRFSGTGRRSFRTEPRLAGMSVQRVDMNMYTTTPAPNRSRLSSVNLIRRVPNEDWSAYNRLSFWFRADMEGFAILPLQIVLHNDGAEKVPDRYGREGIHYVTLGRSGWQQVVWEIDPLARDRVTSIEIGYWINRMLANSTDRVAFEIGRIELQRVDADVHTGWTIGAGKLAYSHSGYASGASKTVLASDLLSADFTLTRVDDRALGEVVLRGPVQTVTSRLGEFQRMDFSEVRTPGNYVLRSDGRSTKPFRIGDDVWIASVWKTLNFFYGNRCGFDVPGVHPIDHLDWFATHGTQKITMSGGWHDAGDLSQGVINTGEGTYTMFALAERLRDAGGDPALVARLIEEARWGLAWTMRVRFPGGHRIGFGSHNYWSNNIVGDADDKSVEAKNNPNANYIAAAAEAIAYRVLRESDPALAARSLEMAEDDWQHAIVGIEGPTTWHTPAFAATRMELAAIGITASLELWRATAKPMYRDKAVELARVVVGSQQRAPVGSTFPLSGFFYTGPDRDTVFHQFHRAADQSPIVALSALANALPDHPEWMTWYATVVRYAEYQKRTATMTAPYGMLPAYVYRLADSVTVPDSGGRYAESQAAYAAQTRSGMSMGEGWYLRAFPVWFSRRGNYGVLLSQAKALADASRLRGDSAGADLAEQQAQWVVGRNPFTQSTMYGEGYDWAQQYSVSSADFVGSLPVGMMSRGVSDLPYWNGSNMYAYKEVWVHTSIRWLALMQDLLDRPAHTNAGARSTPGFTVSSSTAPNGEITIRANVSGTGSRPRTLTLRVDGLQVTRAVRTVPALRAGVDAGVVEWKGRPLAAGVGWVVAVFADGDLSRRREAVRNR